MDSNNLLKFNNNNLIVALKMTNCFRELHIYSSYYYFREVSINNSEPGTSHFVKVSVLQMPQSLVTSILITADFPIDPINMYSSGRHSNHR